MMLFPGCQVDVTSVKFTVLGSTTSVQVLRGGRNMADNWWFWHYDRLTKKNWTGQLGNVGISVISESNENMEFIFPINLWKTLC